MKEPRSGPASRPRLKSHISSSEDPHNADQNHGFQLERRQVIKTARNAGGRSRAALVSPRGLSPGVPEADNARQMKTARSTFALNGPDQELQEKPHRSDRDIGSTPPNNTWRVDASNAKRPRDTQRTGPSLWAQDSAGAQAAGGVLGERLTRIDGSGTLPSWRR
jgi:hypothetical protein